MNSFGYKSPKNLDHWTARMCLPSWFWKSYLSLIPISFLFNSQYVFYPGIHRNRCDKREWYFFLLSSILALNHAVFCHFFFTGSPDFFQTSFGLLMCGLGGWPLVRAFIIFSCERTFPFLLPSLKCKICLHSFGSPAFQTGCGCIPPASQTVFHNVSQTTLCWILILKVSP